MCIYIYNDNYIYIMITQQMVRSNHVCGLCHNRLVVPPGPCHGAGSVSARHAGATPRAPQRSNGDLTRHAMWMLRG